MQFNGSAEPLTKNGLEKTKKLLNAGDAEIWAALTVETRGCGFLPDKRPYILFERHIFSKYTQHVYDKKYPDISNPVAGGYGEGGENQYLRLEKAVQLDKTAALKSASWGIGQVMGFNAEQCGYKNVESMVNAMCKSESEQLLACAKEIIPFAVYLRGHRWDKFAFRYNGPEYAKNNYDARLAAAYKKFSGGLLPDLDLRAAQVYLSYLGYNPGPIDGVMGRFTRAAINEFQQKNGLPLTDSINSKTLALLKQISGAGYQPADN